MEEENDTSLELSEPDTQFVPQEDDDQLLFRVIEITDENAKQYKVRWAGKDPKTKKPWAQSWVSKHDCTSDLVYEWKKKKAKKRASASNTPISGISKASRSRSITQSPSAKTKLSRGKRTSVQVQVDPFWDDPPTAGPSAKKRKTGSNTQHSHGVKRRKLIEPRASEGGPEVNASDDGRPGRSSTSSALSRGREKKPERNGRKDESEGFTRDKGKGKAVEDDEERSITPSPVMPARRSTSRTKGASSLRSQSPVADNPADYSDYAPPAPQIIEEPIRTHSNIRTLQEDEHPEQDPGFGEAVLLQDKSEPRSGTDNNSNSKVEVTSKPPQLSPEDEARLKEFDNFFREVDEEQKRLRDDETRESFSTRREFPHIGRDDLQDPGHEKNGAASSLISPATFKIPSSPESHQPPRINGIASSPPSPAAFKIPSSLPEFHQQPRIQTEGVRFKNAVDTSEVVPETETQSSTDTQHPLERATLISKMKRRSPSKASIISNTPQRLISIPGERDKRNGISHDKPLKPVPSLPPSVFEGLQSSRLETDGDDVDEVDESIEQFSSPEKSGTRVLSLRSKKEAQARKDRQDSDKLRKEGLVMSDKARDARMRAQYGGEIPQKKTLSQVARSAPQQQQQQQHSDIEEEVVTDKPTIEPIDVTLENPYNFEFRYNEILHQPEHLSAPDIQDQSLETDASCPPIPNHKITSQIPSDLEITHMAEKATEEVVDTLKKELGDALTKIVHLEETLAKEHSEKNLQREHVGTLDEKISRLEASIGTTTEEKASLQQKLAGTLDEKNGIISRLEARLATTMEENRALLSKIATLEETVVVARSVTVVPSDPPQDVQVTATAVVEELRVALSKAESDKRRLEEDRDLFREEFYKASGFADGVRKENIELEQRVQIAERQAKEGVAMVKATFQERVKFLEDNAKQAHELASFLMEKDKRTNDDIRKRAAQEPELRRQIETLEADVESKELQIEELEATKKANDEQADAWKAEVVRLTKELHTLKEERVHREQNDRDPDRQVFRCELWDRKGRCIHAFDTPEELEDHIYYYGHLE